MSTVEVAPAPGGGAVAAGTVRRGSVRPWLRLLRSELGLVFRRWRNRALLAAAKKHYRAYSLGMKQRLAIAASLL